jgi:hypothetical protein
MEAGGVNIGIGILCLLLGFSIIRYDLVLILGVVILGIGISLVITGETLGNA